MQTHTHVPILTMQNSSSRSLIVLLKRVFLYTHIHSLSVMHASDLPHDCTHTDREKEREPGTVVECHPHAQRRREKSKRRGKAGVEERGMDRFLRGERQMGEGINNGEWMRGNIVFLFSPTVVLSSISHSLSFLLSSPASPFFVVILIIIPTSIITLSPQHFPVCQPPSLW